MNVLRFKKGYKDWETTYDVELDYEYDERLEKKMSSLIICRQDLGKKAVVPWQVFENYATGHMEGTFADASGLRIGRVNGKLSITQGYNFNVVIHQDQIEAIRRAAKNLVEDVSSSVENILKEYALRA